MCTSSYCYVAFFNVFWILYGVFGFSFQIILVVLILRKLPPSLKNLKFYLINTASIQLALVIFSFSIQHRFLTNKTTLAILPAGPCRYFGPDVCFGNYHIVMASGLGAGLAILITVVFRTFSLTMKGITRKRNYMLIALSYIAPIYVLIVPFTTRWDFQSVQMSTAMDHPTYNLTNYLPFPGFANVESFEFVSATIVIGFGGYGIPFGCIIMTIKGLTLVKKHQNMAEKTKVQARKLIHGLLVQSILPVISYVPMVSSYIYTQTTGNEVLISEHLTLATNSLPGLVDPLIACYFIIPFRHAILDVFCPKSKNVVIIANTSSVAPL